MVPSLSDQGECLEDVARLNKAGLTERKGCLASRGLTVCLERHKECPQYGSVRTLHRIRYHCKQPLHTVLCSSSLQKDPLMARHL